MCVHAAALLARCADVKNVSKELLTGGFLDVVIGVAIRKTRFLQHWTNLPSWLRGFDSHHPLFSLSGYG